MDPITVSGAAVTSVQTSGAEFLSFAIDSVTGMIGLLIIVAALIFGKRLVKSVFGMLKNAAR